MKNQWEINILAGTSVPARSLIKPCKNEHFRWSVFGEAGPFWDCSRCRCARHWAPWATKCGNTHFHCNALVAPSWQLRRPTGQHAHKCRHLSVKIANTGRYDMCTLTKRSEYQHGPTAHFHRAYWNPCSCICPPGTIKRLGAVPDWKQGIGTWSGINISK